MTCLRGAGEIKAAFAELQYVLGYNERGRDLAEEWKMSNDAVQELVAAAVPFTAEVIRETPRSEMLEVARSVA